MPHVSHQTIRLSKGKHHSADQGACVMELASMLAGEPFSDHPHSVSRPIGAFLRRYNDLLDDRRRQDLYPYAARVVGTAAGPVVEEERIELVLAWADQLWMRRRWPARCRITSARRHKQRTSHPEAAGSYAIRAIPKLSDEMHASALALVDELISIGIETAVEVERLRWVPAAVPV
jgi:hypothetical protein